MLLDHIAGANVVFLPHTYHLCLQDNKAATVKNTLVQKLSTVTTFGTTTGQPQMDNMMAVICRGMHGGNEVEFGPQRYKLYEPEDCALKLLTLLIYPLNRATITKF